MADQEGGNGLDYRHERGPAERGHAAGDEPRRGTPCYHPTKYALDGSSPIVLASGVEARLIAAEAALQATGRRRAGSPRSTRCAPTAPRTAAGSTTPAPAAWPGLAPARPIPGTPAARVDLLFRERAFWLFLTGHRQGDLRRLIRQYGRAQEEVYPIGPYPGGYQYGGDVTLPIPPQERVTNPLFTGCASRGA